MAWNSFKNHKNKDCSSKLARPLDSDSDSGHKEAKKESNVLTEGDPGKEATIFRQHRGKIDQRLGVI